MVPGEKNIFNFISFDLFGREERRPREMNKDRISTIFHNAFHVKYTLQSKFHSFHLGHHPTKQQKSARDMGKERHSSLPTQSLRHYPNRKKKKKKKTPSP